MQNNMFYLQKTKFKKMSLNKFYGRAPHLLKLKAYKKPQPVERALNLNALPVADTEHSRDELRCSPYIIKDQWITRAPTDHACRSITWIDQMKSNEMNNILYIIKSSSSSSSECSAQGQVLHCKRRNLDCSSVEGMSSTVNTGTKATVLPGIE